MKLKLKKSTLNMKYTSEIFNWGVYSKGEILEIWIIQSF